MEKGFQKNESAKFPTFVPYTLPETTIELRMLQSKIQNYKLL